MKQLLPAILVLSLAATSAQAIEFAGGDLQVKDNFPIDASRVFAPNVITPEYSNIVNFLGQAYPNGGATLQGTNTITRLVADDITPLGVNGGQSVSTFTFSVANFNATAVTVRPRVRFWFADGAGGAPGTYYNLPAAVGFSFNPLVINPGVTLLTASLAAGQMTMPATTFWAGLTFDNNNGATGATAVQLDNMGQGMFDPPTAGSSQDAFFQTTAAGSFFTTANPAGILTNFGGNPVGSFGWEFTVDVLTPTQATTWGRVKSLYR